LHRPAATQVLDLFRTYALDAGHKFYGNRAVFAWCVSEQEKRVNFTLRRIFSRNLRGHGRVRGTGETGARSQTSDVEDYGNLPVAENRRSRILAEALQVSSHWFDDNFDRVVKLADHKSVFEGAGIHQNDVERPRGAFFRQAPEDVGKVHQRDEPVAQQDQFRVARAIDPPGNLVRRNADQLAYADLWDGEAFSGVGYQ